MAVEKAVLLRLPSVDALSGIPEGKEAGLEISVKQLLSFKEHLFQVMTDEKLLESAKEYGVLPPLLSTKRPDNCTFLGTPQDSDVSLMQGNIY